VAQGTSQALRLVRDVNGTELHHWATRARVFPGGPGKTNTLEDFRLLMNDLESKIFGRFDDDTVVILVMATTPRLEPSGRILRNGGAAAGNAKLPWPTIRNC
jgi:hypothetical protein